MHDSPTSKKPELTTFRSTRSRLNPYVVDEITFTRSEVMLAREADEAAAR
jgi:hypothetical protein